jgi:glutamyl/glutaminyl-tRNA synthetase
MWKKIIDSEKERISKFSEIQEGIGLFFETPEYTKELLKWKTETLEDSKKHLTKILEFINSIDEKEFSLQSIKNLVWPYAEENGKGNVLWPFRTALTGLERSPEPFTVSDILGKSETIKRIKKALDMLK